MRRSWAILAAAHLVTGCCPRDVYCYDPGVVMDVVSDDGPAPACGPTAFMAGWGGHAQLQCGSVRVDLDERDPKRWTRCNQCDPPTAVGVWDATAIAVNSAWAYPMEGTLELTGGAATLRYKAGDAAVQTVVFVVPVCGDVDFDSAVGCLPPN